MTTETKPQEFTFQAEIKQLLHLLSHSLYQNKEIAIRELISNASDALDKFRHISLTDDAYKTDEELQITVEPDDENKILTIADNGIGMTQDELVQNIGTIARSGSLDFIKNLSGDNEADFSLIGQFGVGFYSSFMLADKVVVITRSYQEESGWRWESDGSGSFTIEPVEDVERGTRVQLYLKESEHEFSGSERIKYILQQYSTFMPHVIKVDDEHVNDQQPIWVEPKSQLSQEQYTKFYQYLTHHSDQEPLWHLHLSSDSPFQFHAVLYCPPSNFELMGFGRVEHGLHLCAKRVLVQNDNKELLPEFLRFIHGLVDSADLPLNVSRESLQDNTVFRKIRKVLVKRVLSHLEGIAKKSEEDYLKFYKQFGPVLREGIANEFEHRDSIAGLLRFTSSHSDDEEKPSSLAAYLERAPEDQKQIYYIGGVELKAIKKNPNLEIFNKKNLEVLYITDPIDEFVLTHLMTYKEKQLTSIDSVDIEFPGDSKTDSDDEKKSSETEDAAEDKQVSPNFAKVLNLFREALGEQVKEVRESKRLTESACCLVNPEGAASSQLQKVLSMSNKEFEVSKRIFEINPKAALVERLTQLAGNDQHHGFIKSCGLQLYSNAMLLEGFPPDTESMTQRTQNFMQELAQNRSPLIT